MNRNECTIIQKKITNSFNSNIKLRNVGNHLQLKVSIYTKTDSFHFLISKIQASAYQKHSILLTDDGCSLLNENDSDELSNYLAVCNFQLGYHVDYDSTKAIQNHFAVKRLSKHQFELYSVIKSKNLLIGIYRFITILSTIRTLNKQHYFA